MITEEQAKEISEKHGIDFERSMNDKEYRGLLLTILEQSLLAKGVCPNCCGKLECK